MIINMNIVINSPKSFARLAQAVALAGLMASTGVMASDSQKHEDESSSRSRSPISEGDWADYVPTPPRSASPEAVPAVAEKSSDNNNNAEAAPVDPIDADLALLNQYRADNKGGRISYNPEKLKMSRAKLDEITAGLNSELLSIQNVVNRWNGRFEEGKGVQWFTLNPFQADRVVKICNLMIGPEKLTTEKIEALLSGQLSVLKWTEWKKNLGSFMASAAEVSKLQPVVFADEDAVENAVHPLYLPLPNILEVVKAYVMTSLKEKAQPSMDELLGAATGIDSRSMARAKMLSMFMGEDENKSQKLLSKIKEKSDDFYKELLKVTFVGAEEYLNPRRPQMGGFQHVHLSDGSIAYVSIVSGGDDDDAQGGSGCINQ